MNNLLKGLFHQSFIINKKFGKLIFNLILIFVISKFFVFCTILLDKIIDLIKIKSWLNQVPFMSTTVNNPKKNIYIYLLSKKIKLYFISNILL